MSSQAKGRAGFLVSLIWISSVLPLGADLLCLLLTCGTVAYLVRTRRFWLGCAVLAFSPCVVVFVWSFSWGVREYYAGQAQLRCIEGLSRPRFASVDPQYRCGYRWLPRFKMGTPDWAATVSGAYNSAVRILIRLRGPVKGSYLGPYPSASEASQAMVNGVDISWEDLAQDRVRVGGLTISLDAGVGIQMLRNSLWRYGADEDMCRGWPAIRAVICRNTCLIVRLPALSEDNLKGALLVLIDMTNGRPFACYFDGVRPLSYLLMERWQK